MRNPFLLLLFLVTFLSSCEVKDIASQSKPIQHDTWDHLLKQYVNDAGFVNYQGFIQDSTQFNEYLDLLRNNHPNQANWSREEQLAYWINAYNAFTIKLIVDHYPVESIKKIKPGIPFINSVFDLAFIQIEGIDYSLNNIEHGIIRAKFEEPRIHFAVNCASFSCPKLLNEAFHPQKLNQQLEQATRDFVNDKSKNKLSKNEVQLSRILQWYWSDFKGRYDSKISFLNKYAKETIATDAKVDYIKYNWELNEQQ